jgi:ribosome-binding protein aMBF1 (putative translation factor)
MEALLTEATIGAAKAMLTCKQCGRKIEAAEVKYRTTVDGESVLICPDCAKSRGI